MGQESGSSLLAPPGGDVSFVMVQHVPALLPGSSAQHPSAPCVRQLPLPQAEGSGGVVRGVSIFRM